MVAREIIEKAYRQDYEGRFSAAGGPPGHSRATSCDSSSSHSGTSGDSSDEDEYEDGEEEDEDGDEDEDKKDNEDKVCLSAPSRDDIIELMQAFVPGL